MNINTELQSINISESELPTIVCSQFDLIKNLYDKINEAEKGSERAKLGSQKAIDIANIAKEAAYEANKKSAKLGHKREAIESLQAAQVEQSKALGIFAEAQTTQSEALRSSVEAQSASFQYMEQISKSTKYLFELGVSNIAANRSVVETLKKQLECASQEELPELARQEIIVVIKQLKSQEDIMLKQVRFSGKVREHQGQLESINRQLDAIEKFDEQQDIKVAENTKNISEFKKNLEKQQQKDSEHDKQIEELKKQDKEQDKLIDIHSEKLLEHDKAFEEQHKKNAKLEQGICHNTDRIKCLENFLKNQEQALTEKNNTLDKKYADTAKQLKDELSNLTNTTNRNSETIKENISLILESADTQISLIKEDLSKVETDLSVKINSLEEKVINTITELMGETSNKDKEVYNNLTDLKDRIDSLDVITSKLGWKIGISIVAAGSLILNILQICGIL